MPLIITCGYPSSGKTYRAKQIVRYLEDKINNSIGHPAATESRLQSNGSDDSTASAAKDLSELNLKESTTLSSTNRFNEDSIGPAKASAISTESPPSSTSTLPSPPPSSARSAAPPSRKIHYISDHTLHLPRSAYSISKTEKDARAALYSAVKRVLSRNDIVVLDSGNYIKGWRYQLYCEAKNAGTASCVVHVGVPADKSRELNVARLKRAYAADGISAAASAGDAGNEGKLEVGGSGESDPYDEKVFEELLMRFEEPNAMARWDSPLFTVPWDDPSPPCDQIWAEIVQGIGKDGKNRIIKPNQAAVQTPTTSPSHLYVLDRTTQSIIQAIQTHQREDPDNAGAGGVLTIAVPSPTNTTSSPSATSVSLQAVVPDRDRDRDQAVSAAPRTLTLVLPTQPLTFPHLLRLRRQFTALHRQQMGGLGMGGIGGGIGSGGGQGLSERRVAELFVGYLGERFDEL